MRDFSHTSLLGELAQAVTFAYWHWERGCNVADFRGLAASAGIRIRASSPLPDYIGVDRHSGDVLLIEAKGTCSDDPAAAMNKALRQCRAGLEHLMVPQMLGCVLAYDRTTCTTTLHLRDPKIQMTTPDDLGLTIFRRSYKSWFELIGAQGLAKSMIGGMRFDDAGQVTRKELGRGQGLDLRAEGALAEILAESLGFNPRKARFHVHPAICDVIFARVPLSSLDLGGFGKLSARASEPGAPLEFQDGTAIYEE